MDYNGKIVESIISTSTECTIKFKDGTDLTIKAAYDWDDDPMLDYSDESLEKN